MGRQLLQARCDPDTAEQVEEAKDEMDISKSEFVRRALREKLIRDGYRPTAIGEADAPDDATETYVIGDAELLEEQTDDKSTANINQTVRMIAGVMIGVSTVLIIFAELGLI